jgi:hypothetical protein
MTYSIVPSIDADTLEEDKRPMFKEIYCQRFSVCGAQAKYFEVNVPSALQMLAEPDHKGIPTSTAL